jgi:hypothetical protein
MAPSQPFYLGFRLPSDSLRSEPRLIRASTWPWSAAKRHELTASVQPEARECDFFSCPGKVYGATEDKPLFSKKAKRAGWPPPKCLWWEGVGANVATAAHFAIIAAIAIIALFEMTFSRLYLRLILARQQSLRRGLLRRGRQAGPPGQGRVER